MISYQDFVIHSVKVDPMGVGETCFWTADDAQRRFSSRGLLAINNNAVDMLDRDCDLISRPVQRNAPRPVRNV